MSRNPYVNAFAAAGYIVIVVLVINVFMNPGTPDTKLTPILAPIMMLSLFVLSAAIMGYVFLFQPTMLYFDGSKKEAVELFLRTVGFFACFTAVFILIAYFSLHI